MAARIADQLIDDATITIVVVGSVDETPVSCSMLSVTGATAGIDDVATAVQHRGYGAALTWASIEHGAPQGYDHSILPASEIGAPVDRAMSFADTAFADVGNAVSSKDRHPPFDRAVAAATTARPRISHPTVEVSEGPMALEDRALLRA